MKIFRTLRQRILVSSIIIIAIFLALSALAVMEVYNKQLRHKVYLRLDSMMLDLVSAVDIKSSRDINVNFKRMDDRLTRANTGFYAVIEKENKILWRSPSTPEFFDYKINATDGVEINKAITSSNQNLYALIHGIFFRDITGKKTDYTFIVAEPYSVYQGEVLLFRNNLFLGLGLVTLFVLFLQYFVLKIGLIPLNKIVEEVQDIKNTKRDYLSSDYPEELQKHADLINALLEQERGNKIRYKNSLGDLAHSLKTPLAIIKNTISDLGKGENIKIISDQVLDLSKLIEYHLKRAAQANKNIFKKPIRINKEAEKVINALIKVYNKKNIYCEYDIDKNIKFYGDKDDFVEVLGNLLDNAYKWAEGTIFVNVVNSSDNSKIIIEIADDGPGIPKTLVANILERGARHDKNVAGHGIGMAIVKDIVNSYHGEIEISSSLELGGARIVVVL